MTSDGIYQTTKVYARNVFRPVGEVPRVKWSMIDVSFLADFLKLEGEIGHEEEAVFG
jgi:hypothetical protein